MLADQLVPAGWTGSESGCTVGAESAASVASTERTVNTLRDFAGLPPVTFEAGRNAKALAAALMMRAANALSHTPGPTWPCYSAAGAMGANTSNLFLGLSGAEAMVGYVEDAGVPSLGHRAWLLDPSATVFGTGSTGTSNALLVMDSSPGAPAAPVVAWPPPGWVPSAWVFRDWSLSFATGVVALDGAQVSVKVDGFPVGVSGVFAPANRSLTWRTSFDPSTLQSDSKVDVAVTGFTLGGIPAQHAYSFTVFPALKPVTARVSFDPTLSGFPAELLTSLGLYLSWSTTSPAAGRLTVTRLSDGVVVQTQPIGGGGGGGWTSGGGSTFSQPPGAYRACLVQPSAQGYAAVNTCADVTVAGSGAGPPTTADPSPLVLAGTRMAPSTVATPRPVVCKPPRVVGQTLSVARRKLHKAGCKVGKVIRPKRVRKGTKLVVKSQAGRGPAIRLTLRRKK